MGTWSIQPSHSVINKNNGTFIFPKNVSEDNVNYRIQYENNGITSNYIAYTLKKCDCPDYTIKSVIDGQVISKIPYEGTTVKFVAEK